MTNLELAWALTEMGELLEIKGEEPFKVRAYYRAARTLENMEEEAADYYARDSLEDIPGIGKNLAKKIAELLSTGKSTFLENLRTEVPPGLRQMLAIPGLGSRSVRQIYQGLGVDNLDDLEKAARERRVRTLPGMGNKTELHIIRGLEMLREFQERVPLGVARPLALLLQRQLMAIPGVERAEIAGSVRRGCEMVGDIDLVVAVRPGCQAGQVMVRHPRVKEVMVEEPDRLVLRTYLGLKIEILLVEPQDFAAAFFYATGSPPHRQKFLTLTAARGVRAADLGLNTVQWREAEAEVRAGLEAKPEGLFQELEKQTLPRALENSASNIADTIEASFYSRLDLPYIVPELREDRGEVEAAIMGELPRLLTLDDIKGDLHIHSSYSDGTATITEMAAAARARGYRYMAVTDHSRSLVIARGLSVERILEQRAEIARLNEQLNDFTILSGIEVDVLADGRLDYEDEVIKDFDLVIASLHTGFRQTEAQIMARIESALRHPYVDILGHPTGRMLGKRRPYAVDVTRIIELAAETGTILEINSSPDRLDLNDRAARLAKETGVLIAISTDAHDPSRLSEMEYGVITARRGWLEPKDVVNTWELADLLAVLKRRRGREIG